MCSQNWSGYGDFLKQSAYAAFPQEHRESKGTLPFLMVHSQQRAHNFTDPAVSESLIALPLHADSHCVWEWSINGQYYRHKARPGSMMIVPSNTESQWEVNANRTLLVLTLPDDTIKKLYGGACPEQFHNLFSPLSEQTWEEPLIESMIRKLWVNSSSGSLANSFLSDGLITSIISQLLLMSGTKLEDNTKVVLPKWRMNKVRAYVDENIGADISLDNLAAAAGLSLRHFSRSFHQETGDTPNNWVMKLRIEKVKKMLLDTQMPIADIARACGFSSQSYLTTVMKNLTGQTPNRWRLLYRV